MESLNKNTIKLDTSIIRKYTPNRSQLNNQKVIAYLYAILTFFSISFFGYFAVNPTLSTIANLQKQYDDMKIVDDKLTQKLDALQKLSIQYQQIQPSIDSLYDALPVSPQAAYVVGKIETLIAEKNLDLRVLETGPTEIFPAQKQSEGQYSFNINISFVGSVEDMYTFVAELINFDRMINIEEINVFENKQEEKGFNISIKGRAYFNK